jgi:hypothetical protein
MYYITKQTKETRGFLSDKWPKIFIPITWGKSGLNLRALPPTGKTNNP